jgi:hypothetical protein
MQTVKAENPPTSALAMRGDERSPALKKKGLWPVCYNCSRECERYDKCMLELWLEIKVLKTLEEK